MVGISLEKDTTRVDSGNFNVLLPSSRRKNLARVLRSRLRSVQ
jgi:hypothetical protein